MTAASHYSSPPHEDLRDLTLAVSRSLIDKPDMMSFDDALTAYGLTESDLDSADDLEETPTGGAGP